MVKLKHSSLLVLGMTKLELERFREGMPLDIPLDDVGLKGQRILLIPGEDNDTLLQLMKKIADAYENGATSPIEIIKQLPKGHMQ
jgi:hypothetical protein